MPDDVRTVLSGLDVFDGTEPAVLDRLASLAHPFEIEAGEHLFREGDPGDRIFLLSSGHLHATMRLPGGRDLEVLPVIPGELVGEMAVLARKPRRFSVHAEDHSAGWSWSAAEVGRLAASGFQPFVAKLGRIALQRLRDQYERLGELCASDPRVAAPAREGTFDADARPLHEVDPEPDESAYLETVLFFSSFSEEELEELFGGLRRLDAERGTTVIEAGTRSAPLHIVIKGAVETTIRRGGLAARARLAGPGRMIGHLGLLDDGPTPATYRAREHSILLEVPLQHVAEALARGDDASRLLAEGVYADVVDALFEAQRPLSRMAALG
jgi:CRP-like cAMP-binding protein